jgi:hypothetical protein
MIETIQAKEDEDMLPIAATLVREQMEAPAS